MKFIINAALIFLTLSTFAQDYVITLKRDTIYGKIEFAQNTFYDEVFIRTSNGKETYKIFQLDRISKNDHFYEKVIYGNKNVVGQTLIEGPVSYYLLMDEETSNFTTRYLVKKSGENMLVPTIIGFKKNISKFFSECEELSRRIDEKELGPSDLEKIVNFYNNDCSK